ncbi:putative sensor histidine kinase YycG [Peptostreptococcaceae bacterium AS15]|nr:putative sensor histidine kinase YycG [Peptostreptococcaceae bacterium AS15]
MKNSLKYKMIMIYFLLVFVAMVIVGVFINSEFEKYNMNLVRNDMINISQNIIDNMSILSRDDFYSHKNELQSGILDMPISKSYEVSIIDPFSYDILASTNSTFESQNAFSVLNEGVLLDLATENVVEKDILIESDTEQYSIKNMAFANKNDDGSIRYILYERRSLDDIDSMLRNVTLMIIKATLLALFITIFFGYFVSNSITIPIKKLTRVALIVSKGDFSAKVKINSTDEIGQLGSTFNYLTKNLENMIKELSSEKSKLNAIIYHMQNGLVAIDNFGKIIHCNANFVNIINSNQNVDALINKSYDDVISTFTDELSFSMIIRNYSNNKSEDITLNINDKYYTVSSAVFKEENGALAGIIVVFQDITESRRLEELRRDFVANVSHELKTPITSIKSYTETLLDGAIDDKDTATSFLTVINNESDRMNNIIKDLLQLSHMDYKKESWDMALTDINALTRDCILKMTLYADMKNQKIVGEISNDKLPVIIDKSKFEQVIINLVSNAIKYTNDNGTIIVKTFVNDGKCHISVTDDGIGIPEKDLPFIFDRFYRVDKGRSRSLGGTGLGLSICESIIAEHGGTISVTSTFGEGSTFTVIIPM